MDADLKKILKAAVLAIRHSLEGKYNEAGIWQPGDLESRLAEIGVRQDRESVPAQEMPNLTLEDQQARRVVDGYLKLRVEAGVSRSESVREFVRESAYTWANRLLALRCMEARELIDEAILQKDAYGGRSLEHHRMIQRDPSLTQTEDDGRFAMLNKVFTEQAQRLPMLFDPSAPAIALRPSPSTLKQCLDWLSGTVQVRSQMRASDAIFQAADSLGWTYQYWNTEEKDRVFEKVRTVKGAKIAGADIIPATQLYTEDYMVKFLVQNSLGATWLGMYPNSSLPSPGTPGEGSGVRVSPGWQYYVRDADRAPVQQKPLREITFLDPACGSGHFLIEAFDMFYDMYLEEGLLSDPMAICQSILENNLFGIDIDARAVQIAEAALWMKAAERAIDYSGSATNLVAATASHLRGPAWEEFLTGFEQEPSVARVLRKFAQTMEHIDEIGSLARPAEDLHEIIEEEHALWERQIRTKKEANFLFPEMTADALSGLLPFQEISDDEFGDRLFYRAKAGIDAFTERARESGEFEDQMLGNETRAGFRLVDLLSRKYDVVVANPPYMGKNNMSNLLKSQLGRDYPTGRKDLYAAFMLRSTSLGGSDAYVAVVVPQTWMFLSSFSDLRTCDKNGILRTCGIETIAQLGRHAFSEVDPPSNVVLVCWRVGVPSPNHTISCFRLVDPQKSEMQAMTIANCAIGRMPELTFKPQQSQFALLPQSPLSYWLGDNWLSLFNTLPSFGEVSYVREGLHTTNNTRFVRCFWECPEGNRWVPYLKGGGYRRWAGLEWLCVDWGNDGARIRQMKAPVIPSRDLYFRKGYTYTDIARGSLALRFFDSGRIFDAKGPVILAHDGDSDGLAAFANSRPVTFLLRALSPTQQFRTGYVSSLPVPQCYRQFAFLGQKCVAAATFEQSTSITERLCDPHIVSRRTDDALLSHFAINAIRLVLEAAIERAAFHAYKIGPKDIAKCCQQLGSPAGWSELLSEFDALPETSVYSFVGQAEFKDLVHDVKRRNQSVDTLMQLKRSVSELFRQGFGVNDTPQEISFQEDVNTLVDDCDVDEREIASSDTKKEIPSETSLEAISRELDVHPVSIYWILKDGIENEGWRCLSEERRIWTDRVTVTALRLLGHRWPKQIDADEPIPDWADPDGIIPLTPLANESTFSERVESRLRDDKADASDFTELMSKPLDAWLATEFFKHHTKQFKKRAIAWQLQSGKFTARKSPAFSCLVYYHKLDADTLPKIRSQYVGPLRNRMETELRGIVAVAVDARSDAQEKRRIELEDAIQELADFDAKLAQVSIDGFATKNLTKLLADEPLDRYCSLDGTRAIPATALDFIAQESSYSPDINDGVRVNIAPLQKAGLLAADVLAKKDVDKAIADRAEWRSDERRWVREGKLPQPGWWPGDSQ